MNIQKKLYASAERKLVAWCVVAMLLMSASFIIAAYLVTTNWLEQSSAELRQLHHDRRELVFALVFVQGTVLVVGTTLSISFARKALKPIRRAHQAQADFAANAHHQLRTPIAVMQAEVDTALLRENQQPADYRQTLKSLLDELYLLRTTSEQLLLQADGASSDKVYQTSKDTSGVLSMLKHRYAIEITTDIKPGIHTTVSQEELAICLETLLDNTKKHARRPSEDLRVRVALEGHGGMVRLTYQDNGEGILEGEEKQIFKRHFRGKPAVKSNLQGSGLGLAILTDIVKAHEGTLSAANVPSGGCGSLSKSHLP